MNEYIINPSWFYWISVCEGIKALVFVFVVLCGAGFIVNAIYYSVNTDYGDDDEAVFYKKWAVRFGVAVIVAVFIGILIPSKETLIQMKLAELGTYDNANKAIEMIQDATDYILDHIKGE